MAERAKGNILYEIIIVVLVLALLGSILYPAKIWKREAEEELVCRTRLEAIQQLELQYITLTGTYTDSLPKLIQSVTGDEFAVDAIDSLINWDRLITNKQLEAAVLGKDMPGELTSLIRKQLSDGKPLGYLAQWDSLEYRLLAGVKNKIETAEADSEFVAINENIYWAVLLGENGFYNLLENENVPDRLKRNSRQQIQRRGLRIFETSGWDSYYKPLFYDALKGKMDVALNADIWDKETEDEWDKAKKASWFAEFDALPQVEKDSIWTFNQKKLWDRQKELIWKDERKKLFREEKEAWTEKNKGMWEQVIIQRWKGEYKKDWKVAEAGKITEELLAVIPSQNAYLDSLWNVQEDSLFNAHFEDWKAGQTKMIDETIYTLWSTDRRFAWEESSYQNWIENHEANPEKLWSMIKEELWNLERPELWRIEEDKKAAKIGTLRRIDQAVIWEKILGTDAVDGIVDNLQLPNAAGLWKKMSGMKNVTGSKIAKLGLAGMFREEFLEAMDVCPVSQTPYMVSVIDTSVIKQVSLHCPIADTMKPIAAYNVDIASGDTTTVPLQLTFLEKILGGGSIKNHGHIDTDGKKSWERRSR